MMMTMMTMTKSVRKCFKVSYRLLCGGRVAFVLVVLMIINDDNDGDDNDDDNGDDDDNDDDDKKCEKMFQSEL